MVNGIHFGSRDHFSSVFEKLMFQAFRKCILSVASDFKEMVKNAVKGKPEIFILRATVLP